MRAVRVIFLICFFICSIFTLSIAKIPNVKLLDAFIPDNYTNSNYISKLSEISSGQLFITIETNDIDSNEELKSIIENKIKSLNSNNDITSEVIDVYKNYPINFLTFEDQRLLKEKKYDAIRQNSLNMLYNPLGVYIASLEKDPFLFATNFVLHKKSLFEDSFVEKDGKIYSLIRFECKNTNDVEKIKQIISQIQCDTTYKIYLSGTPVHTYETQKRCAVEINIICIFSFLMLIFMCKYFLKSYKILIPIILSILFGFLSGFTFSTLIFKKLHVLTFVFSTSLIGISLDYSLHYYLSKNSPKFNKSLFTSMLSTVIMFGLLSFSNIQILKEISVFVSFGLLGVYVFVCLFLDLFNISFADFVKIDLSKICRYKKIFLFLILCSIAIGTSKLSFDDSIKNLYKPDRNLLQAEVVFKKVFNNSADFILIKGKNVDEILQKQEKIISSFDDSVKFLALSSFIASREQQKQNIELVNLLYKEKLNSYAGFLDTRTRNNLLRSYEIYDPENFPLNNKFMLDDNTSYMMILSPTKGIETFNIAREITKIIKKIRHKCMFFVPFVFFILFGVMRVFYSTKQAFKILFPAFLGGIFAISVVCLFDIGVNIFHILAFILSLGFSLDYSIFRLSGDKNSNLAVLISASSTVFSFLLLSFTSFKLISSLGVVLSLGIFSSYILSLLLIKSSSVQDSENI